MLGSFYRLSSSLQDHQSERPPLPELSKLQPFMATFGGKATIGSPVAGWWCLGEAKWDLALSAENMCSKDREKSLGYLRIAKRCSNSLNGSLKEIQTHAKCIWKGNFNPISLLGNLAFGKCVNLSLLMFLMKREHQIGVMLSEPQSCLCLIQSNFPSSFHALLSPLLPPPPPLASVDFRDVWPLFYMCVHNNAHNLFVHRCYCYRKFSIPFTCSSLTKVHDCSSRVICLNSFPDRFNHLAKSGCCTTQSAAFVFKVQLS